MQPRAMTRAALALGVTLAVTLPTAAAAATSNDPPASGTTGAAVGLAVELAKDGNGPFTPEDGPGADTGATNGVVRTLDAVTYRVTMKLDGWHEHERTVHPHGTRGHLVGRRPRTLPGSGFLDRRC